MPAVRTSDMDTLRRLLDIVTDTYTGICIYLLTVWLHVFIYVYILFYEGDGDKTQQTMPVCFGNYSLYIHNARAPFCHFSVYLHQVHLCKKINKVKRN